MPFKAPVLRPRGSKPPGTVTRSRDAAERQKLYATQRWRRLRLAHLKDNPLCVECDKQGLLVPAVVVDHAHGHAGDWRDRFFDADELQSLCQTCHNSKSAREMPRAT
jgi:5-methylcytosine-specific restriction protein A